jgi:hypothetical protein
MTGTNQPAGYKKLVLGASLCLTQSKLTNLWRKVEQLKVVACMVQCNLTRHCDVGQRLLQSKDVTTHLLDAPLINTVDVLSGADQDLGD